MRRFYLFLFVFVVSLTACARREQIVFADADALADAIYEKAALSHETLYQEALGAEQAYLFGMERAEFEGGVTEAICCRKSIDDNGQLIYVLKLSDPRETVRLCSRLFARYDFVPCDPAEQMAVLGAGEYLVFVKSERGEVERTSDAFRTLMGGRLDFENEKDNYA